MQDLGSSYEVERYSLVYIFSFYLLISGAAQVDFYTDYLVFWGMFNTLLCFSDYT